MKRKKPVDGSSGAHKQICANCKKEYIESDFGLLARFLMGQEPTCSAICNQALKTKGKK